MLVLNEAQDVGEEARTFLRGARIEIEKQSSSVGFDSAAAFLSESHLAGWWTRAPTLSGETLHFLMTELCDVCRRTDPGPVTERVEVRRLVRAVVAGQASRRQDPDFAWALKALRPDAGSPRVDELTSLLSHVAEVLERHWRDRDGSDPAALKHSCRNLGKSVFETFGASGDRLEIFQAVRNDFRFSGEAPRKLLAEIVLGGWLAAVDASPDKAGALKRYRDWTQADDFFSPPWIRMAETVFEHRLSNEERERQARSWVESGDVKQFSDGFAGVVLEQASRAVKFAPDDPASGALAEELSALDTEKVALPRLVLRTAVRVLMDGSRTTIRWTGVDEPTYREFISALQLPTLLSRPRTPAAYGTLLRSIINEGLRRRIH